MTAARESAGGWAGRSPPPVGTVSARSGSQWITGRPAAAASRGQFGDKGTDVVLLGRRGPENRGAPGVAATEMITGALADDLTTPRCAAAVHHGGIGTTFGRLFAGPPTLICSVSFDQPMWGGQVDPARVCGHLTFADLVADSLTNPLPAVLRPETCDRPDRFDARDWPGTATSPHPHATLSRPPHEPEWHRSVGDDMLVHRPREYIRTH